jgi:hypothetical protein
MKRAVSLTLALVLAASALLLAWMWRVRSALTYNDEGRYFDSADSVVYSDSRRTPWAPRHRLYHRHDRGDALGDANMAPMIRHRHPETN